MVNIKTAVPILVSIGIIIWLFLLWTKKILTGVSFVSLKEIPTAAGYAGALAMIFSQWACKFPIFYPWLVCVPNLNGTWKGTIKSEYEDRISGEKVSPIDAFLVIRQSLFRISCTLLTKESKSRSCATRIDCDQDGNVLAFIYLNSPITSVLSKSKPHDGAATLDIISNPSRRLKGKYWTNRDTKGEMDFEFSSSEHQEVF